MGKIDQVKRILDNALPGSLTFLNDKVDDRLLYHEGFELERTDMIVKRIVKAGGGLLCYIQNDITYERRTDLENPTIEISWLEMKFATSKIYL